MKMWSAILQTWGKRCDVLKFFVDPLPEGSTDTIPSHYTDPTSGISREIIILPMVRKLGNSCWAGGRKDSFGKEIEVPCRHIWEKVWRMWVYMAENETDQAEWFLKVDDDTFCLPENLKQYILHKGYRPSETHYFGHKLYQHGVKNTLIAGALTVFSRETLIQVAPVYSSMPKEYGDRRNFKHGRCVDRDGATEEKTSSICLKSIGITAEETFNELGEERVIIFSPVNAFQSKRRANSGGWYFANKPEVNQGGDHCCATDAFGLHHFKNPDFMYRINDLLYSSSSELEERLNALDSVDDESSQKSIVESKHVRGKAYKKEVKFYYEMRERLKALDVGNIF